MVGKAVKVFGNISRRNSHIVVAFRRQTGQRICGPAAFRSGRSVHHIPEGDICRIHIFVCVNISDRRSACVVFGVEVGKDHGVDRIEFRVCSGNDQTAAESGTVAVRVVRHNGGIDQIHRGILNIHPGSMSGIIRALIERHRVVDKCTGRTGKDSCSGSLHRMTAATEVAAGHRNILHQNIRTGSGEIQKPVPAVFRVRDRRIFDHALRTAGSIHHIGNSVVDKGSVADFQIRHIVRLDHPFLVVRKDAVQHMQLCNAVGIDQAGFQITAVRIPRPRYRHIVKGDGRAAAGSVDERSVHTSLFAAAHQRDILQSHCRIAGNHHQTVNGCGVVPCTVALARRIHGNSDLVGSVQITVDGDIAVNDQTCQFRIQHDGVIDRCPIEIFGEGDFRAFRRRGDRFAQSQFAVRIEVVSIRCYNIPCIRRNCDICRSTCHFDRCTVVAVGIFIQHCPRGIFHTCHAGKQPVCPDRAVGAVRKITGGITHQHRVCGCSQRALNGCDRFVNIRCLICNIIPACTEDIICSFSCNVVVARNCTGRRTVKRVTQFRIARDITGNVVRKDTVQYADSAACRVVDPVQRTSHDRVIGKGQHRICIFQHKCTACILIESGIIDIHICRGVDIEHPLRCRVVRRSDIDEGGICARSSHIEDRAFIRYCIFNKIGVFHSQRTGGIVEIEHTVPADLVFRGDNIFEHCHRTVGSGIEGSLFNILAIDRLISEEFRIGHRDRGVVAVNNTDTLCGIQILSTACIRTNFVEIRIIQRHGGIFSINGVSVIFGFQTGKINIFTDQRGVADHRNTTAAVRVALIRVDTAALLSVDRHRFQSQRGTAGNQNTAAVVGSGICRAVTLQALTATHEIHIFHGHIRTVGDREETVAVGNCDRHICGRHRIMRVAVFTISDKVEILIHHQRSPMQLHTGGYDGIAVLRQLDGFADREQTVKRVDGVTVIVRIFRIDSVGLRAVAVFHDLTFREGFWIQRIGAHVVTCGGLGAGDPVLTEGVHCDFRRTFLIGGFAVETAPDIGVACTVKIIEIAVGIHTRQRTAARCQTVGKQGDRAIRIQNRQTALVVDDLAEIMDILGTEIPDGFHIFAFIRHIGNSVLCNTITVKAVVRPQPDLSVGGTFSG